MILTDQQIRLMISDILLEGFKDDQRWLIEKYPDHINALNQLQPKWISWLTARFGENPTREEIHPFEEALDTVQKFAKRDTALSEKYKSNNSFRSVVDQRFPVDARSWTTPADSTTMSVDDMELILGLSERKKPSIETDLSKNQSQFESDRIGKVGPWNLWMPTTMEHSCEIAQYDPLTQLPKTTWCTARTSGSNLFYYYVGRQEESVILFYIIKDEPSEKEDWLSVGFLNGKPILDGKSGGLSVDRENKGLKPETLSQILGPDYGAIMSILNKKAAEMQGKHPAQQMVRDAAKDVNLYKKMLAGKSKDEAHEMKTMIFKLPDVAPEILEIGIADPNEYFRSLAASNKNLTREQMEKLAATAPRESNTVYNLSMNPYIDVDVLIKMFPNLGDYARARVLARDDIPVDMIRDEINKIASVGYTDKYYEIVNSVISNPLTPTDVLQTIMDSSIGKEKSNVHMTEIARNPNASTEQLDFLFNYHPRSKILAIMHPNISQDKLTAALENKEDKELQILALANPNVPVDILVSMISKPKLPDKVRTILLKNPSLPPAALKAEFMRILKKDDITSDDHGAFMLIGMNPNTPVDLLKTLARMSPSSKMGVANNKNAPDEILQMIIDGRATEDTKKDARKNLARRAKARAKMNEAMSRVIRRLLR